MSWNGYAWWWWWIAFVVIFFLLPLGYGWGYRGWGPWYRRPGTLAAGTEPGAGESAGWGGCAVILWIIVIIAIFWLIAGWGWGPR
jgi:hypothetical protein